MLYLLFIPEMYLSPCHHNICLDCCSSFQWCPCHHSCKGRGFFKILVKNGKIFHLILTYIKIFSVYYDLKNVHGVAPKTSLNSLLLPMKRSVMSHLRVYGLSPFPVCNILTLDVCVAHSFTSFVTLLLCFLIRKHSLWPPQSLYPGLILFIGLLIDIVSSKCFVLMLFIVYLPLLEDKLHESMILVCFVHFCVPKTWNSAWHIANAQ